MTRTSVDSFTFAINSARNAVLHLRLTAQRGSQDAALSVVLKVLETAEQAMRAVPGLDALNAQAAAEAAAD